ncbi:MAG: DUF2911 domain-containing protein [Bacteroidota bacterium]
MKKILLTLFAASLFATSFGQITTPQPSPGSTLTQTVGLTEVTVKYYRPKMKGRKIYGEGSDFLVPYGQIWRTGANQGTVISFSDDVTIGGKTVPVGDYLIFTKPGATEWTVMFYKDLSIGGNVNAYDESKEEARFTAKATKLGNTVETFTVNIADISEDNTTAHLQFAWENTAVNLPITVEFDKKVMEAIAQNTQVNPGNYLAAANYFYSTDKDLNKALEWVNLYLAEEKNSKQFWNIHLKAQILAKMGNKKEAIETAEKSMELAKNFPQGDFGYIKRNEDLIASVKKGKK